MQTLGHVLNSREPEISNPSVKDQIIEPENSEDFRDTVKTTLNFSLKQDFLNTSELAFTPDEFERLKSLREKLPSEQFQQILQAQLQVKRKQLDQKLRRQEQEQNRLKLRNNFQKRIEAARDGLRAIADQARRRLHIEDDG
ncbi:hypothetical protein [Picosynechococcus sp. NKBG15041c]|uniref:hypothetical protein n=1 Tax=Picosynechococcus sp. NKBG15041c TaxID=1407650 RepID=UPI0004637DB7|nr:hypothetical protein [Picosynechococcus sp. NKBG15041c]